MVVRERLLTQRLDCWYFNDNSIRHSHFFNNISFDIHTRSMMILFEIHTRSTIFPLTFTLVSTNGHFGSRSKDIL